MTELRAGAVALVLLLGACGQDASVTTWTYDGDVVDASVMESYRGTEHCDWTDVTILRMAWPLGTSGTGGAARTYVRDPEHELDDQTVADFDATPEFPTRARFTGYASDDGELWLDPAEQDRVAYVVRDDGQVEAWPRTETLLGCD